jgi:hypothetical protein
MNWNIDWWKAQTKNTVVADMKAWATLTDDGYRTACYTADKALWPVDCSIYNGDAKNLPNQCLQQIWQASGCSTTITTIMNWNIDWWKAQTKNTVVADMKAWATLTDGGHRTACYTANKALWPY